MTVVIVVRDGRLGLGVAAKLVHLVALHTIYALWRFSAG